MDYSLYTIEDLLTDEHFIKYCLREESEAVAFWEETLGRHPELVAKSAQAERLFFILSVKLDPKEKEQQLLKLRQRLEPPLAEVAEEETQTKRVRFGSLRTWISAAAAILICVGIFTIISRKDGSTTIPSYQEISKARVLKTDFNERREVKLPDGSRVILNGLTELKIDANYNQENRVLWLKGEAFFSVAKNKDKPFIVISGRTVTTALGTSFKINNYSDNKPVSVMLTTGKVNVGKVAGQKIENHLELLPGEKADVTESDSQFVKSSFDLRDIENWTSRRLVFSMASLKEIKTILKGVYGVEIETVNHPKKPIAFTGEFSNQTLTEVLDAIGFSNHFSYTINNNKVMLDFKK